MNVQQVPIETMQCQQSDPERQFEACCYTQVHTAFDTACCSPVDAALCSGRACLSKLVAHTLAGTASAMDRQRRKRLSATYYIGNSLMCWVGTRCHWYWGY